MYEDLKFWYLRDHKLFRTLSSSQLKQLCIIVGFKKAKRGEIIFFEDADTPKIFLLKRGKIKIVSQNEAGDEITKEILQAGDIFGEMALEPNEKNDEIAIALTTDVTLCSFLLSDFEELMTKHPELALSYIKFVGLRMRRVKNNYSNLIAKDVRSRLKIFFMEWIEKEGKKENEVLLLDNYLTQSDIAQIICTSRQSVATLFTELESKDILEYTRKQIKVLDILKLEQF